MDKSDIYTNKEVSEMTEKRWKEVAVVHLAEDVADFRATRKYCDKNDRVELVIEVKPHDQWEDITEQIIVQFIPSMAMTGSYINLLDSCKRHRTVAIMGLCIPSGHELDGHDTASRNEYGDHGRIRIEPGYKLVKGKDSTYSFWVYRDNSFKRK